jgi:hypothetical protein
MSAGQDPDGDQLDRILKYLVKLIVLMALIQSLLVSVSSNAGPL